MMKRTRALAAGVALVVLASCTSSDHASTESTTTGGGTVEAADLEVGDGGNPFVQDLWVYERLRTVNGDAAIVDHTERIVEAVAELEASDPVELIPGVDFVPRPELGAHLKGPDGEPRLDASAVAGLLETEDGVAFAVLGTVDADGGRQLGVDDRVFTDMSFLGSAIELGDVVSADLVLVQLMPTGEPAERDMAVLELAAHRAQAEALQYTADDDGDVVLLTGQLGRIVAGSEGPELPVKSSDELTDGLIDGLRKCFAVDGLRCASRLLDRFGRGATKNFDQNMDQVTPDPLEPTLPRLPEPPPPPPPPCRFPPCGYAIGDPFLTTFDGHRYGMHAVGELVLARHAASEVEIQIRTFAVNEQVSQVDRVAIRVGGSMVIVGPDEVIVDGEVFDPARPASVESDDLTLIHLPRTTTIETSSGHVISLRRAGRGHLDIVVAPESADGGWVGLLGDAGGTVDDDLATSDGEVYPLDLSFEDLYQDVVSSWRLTDETSLFDYADGESTATYTDLSRPHAPVSVGDLGDQERLLAEAACRLAGIELPTVMEQCTIDFAATDDIDLLRSARLSQAVELALQGGTSGGDGRGAEERDAWAITAENLLGVGGVEETATHICPPLRPDGLYTVWGDGIYHGGSSICAAAVHAGAVDAATGGSVTIVRAMGESGESYAGIERNGIQSSSWAGNSWGFVIER